MTYFSCFYNYAPQFTNLVQGAKLSVYENSTFVYDINAKDTESFSYSICGGDDAGFFCIDPKTGKLSFKTAMDYENPLSKSGDNVYEVTVKVMDIYGAYSLRTIQVEVKDVQDAADANGCYVIEAEDFISTGFTTACSSTASGGEIVRLACPSGSLTTTFEGDSGKYNLSLFAQDENDGISTLCIYVDGKLAGTIKLDRQSDGSGSDNGTFSKFDLSGLDIENGDKIRIEAYNNCGEYVRIDKICLEPVADDACTETVTIAAETFQSGAYGWNVCTTSYDPDLGKYLGNFGRCEYPSKTFEVPADAESVKVAFDLYVIDSWDGEHMYVKVEDTVVDLGSFGWWFAVGHREGEIGGIKFAVDTVKGPTHLTGQDCYDYNKDQIVHVTLDVPAAKIQGNDMTLTFGSSLDEARSNESFGLDNVVITAEIPCETDPADASLSGRYFIDADGDNTEWNAKTGTWEKGVADATVVLVKDGAIVATTTTAADGSYSFGGLEAGDYHVAFREPGVAVTAGYVFDKANVGADGEDSDVIGLKSGYGYTSAVTVGESQHVVNVDAGAKDPMTASLGGRYYIDADGDDTEWNAQTGTWENGVAGATVWLLKDGAVVATTTTDGWGTYNFACLAAGDYTVSFQDPATAKGAGYEFIAANVGADGEDSDVVTIDGNGSTAIVSVGVGACVWNVDAGIAAGTAEIGNLAFLDVDKDGIYSAGIDQALAGVAVKLYDGAGNEVASTVTAADGSYRFAGLTAGSYQVGFAAMAGLAFTLESAQAADAADNDSDADILTGLTDVFDLAIGETETGIDAGYYATTVAADDAGKGCADEEVTVDVLANDEVAEGGSLSVATIGGQSAASGTVYLSGTATVTLADNSIAKLAYSGLEATLTDKGIVFDAETALLGLNYGEKATVTVSYGIADGEGGTGEASIELTFCGVAETLDQIHDSLPAAIKYQVAEYYVEGMTNAQVGDFAFDIALSGSGDARFDGAVITKAFCIDEGDPVDGRATLADAPLLDGKLYVGIDNLPADFFDASQVGRNGHTALGNMNNIAWLLNQDFSGTDYTDSEIQYAIWLLTDNVANSTITNGFKAAPQMGEAADVFEIYNLAISAEADAFDPATGEIVPVFLAPAEQTEGNQQIFVLAMSFSDLDCLC
ncbi:SdrD B-like domain-containing protein [Mangrovicoccus ximenensis]|uniref:SdrD B-like domain-containing protein n=1 Tax=Mangrovicoccus ximenensis TaxID=1911570 RepID=UPI000D33802E|nr:SdrD B-like domain-containing protein [Mangrovicoccus ximenensis]